MKVYQLASHDAWQSSASTESLGVFSTLQNAVQYLRGHVKANGFNSKDEGFTVFEQGIDNPDSAEKIFCTCEREIDHKMIIWYDKGLDQPGFYRIGVSDSKGVRDELIAIHTNDSPIFLSLIYFNKLFISFDSRKVFDDLDTDDHVFEFTSEAKRVPLDELIQDGIVCHLDPVTYAC
jgi:hypothetical protein